MSSQESFDRIDFPWADHGDKQPPSAGVEQLWEGFTPVEQVPPSAGEWTAETVLSLGNDHDGFHPEVVADAHNAVVREKDARIAVRDEQIRFQQQQLAEAREDSRRLDWLIETGNYSLIDHDSYSEWPIDKLKVRAAIDAALAEIEKP